MLLYCYTVLMLYSYTVMLVYCYTVLLFYCSTVMLLYCSTVMLLYCYTVVPSSSGFKNPVSRFDNNYYNNKIMNKNKTNRFEINSLV